MAAGEISLGRELRRAREVRGISLEQIAAETKISERYLQALEGDRLDLLPGALYARNFVRQYAQYIGADEEELLDYFAYQQRIHDDTVARTERAAGESARRRTLALAGLGIAAAVIVAVLVISVLAKGGDEKAGDAGGAGSRPPAAAASRPGAPERPASSPPSLPVLAPPTPQAEAPLAGATGAPGTAERPVAESASAPTVDPAAPQPVPAAPLDPAAAASDCPEVPVAKLVFREESWVEVRREGDPTPKYGIQSRGTVLTYQVDKPLTIFVGNAGRVSLVLDGMEAKPLGAAGESRKLSLNCRNFRSYL